MGDRDGNFQKTRKEQSDFPGEGGGVLVLRRLREPSRAINRATISRSVSLADQPRHRHPNRSAALSRAAQIAGFTLAKMQLSF